MNNTDPIDTGPIHIANKLLNRAEQIIKDLVAAIKLRPAGGFSSGVV